MQKLILKRLMREEEGEALTGKFLDESYIKYPIITEDTDAFDTAGNLLLRFRKGVIPLDILKTGVDNFEGSIQLTESRGKTSGYSGKRIRKDGSVSKITVGAKVLSGAVGMMDPVAMVPYCRKTAFTAAYYDKYKAGIPFVQKIDELYAQLAPQHYAIQKQYAEATNPNWVIGDTAFTTVTVNKNFRTAAHKDAGDLSQGFGNLIAYREGDWTGAYFMLPEYGVGVDLQNGDVLFVDVHKVHCNTPFINFDEDTCKRISFVLYYREYMLKCDSPEAELQRIKQEKNGFFTI
jgi:hypothetical protein